jgi:hypothetical protein
MTWSKYNVIFYREDVSSNRTDGSENAEIVQFFEDLQRKLDEGDPPFGGGYYVMDRESLTSLDPPENGLSIEYTYTIYCYFCGEGKPEMRLASVGENHVGRVCIDCMNELILKGKAVSELEEWLHE